MKYNIKSCPVCSGQGMLKVKRRGFRREYFMRCRNCHAETAYSLTPQLALREWKLGYVFGGARNAL